jgi:uncharacterized protein YdaU (DUF1376 family)
VEDAVASSKSTKSYAAFQFYPKEFLSSDKVARMSLTEVGVYITLLSYAWLSKGLPPEPVELAKLVRMPTKRFTRMWAGVLSECFVHQRGKLVNPRQERQRKELEDYIAACARGGERSAASRALSRGTSQPQRSDARSDARSDLQVTPNTASASSSSTASSTPKGTQSVPLIARRRPDAAFEFERVYVPQRKHADLLAAHGNESELVKFYERIAGEWSSTGPYAAANPGDMFRFWQARYDEWKPPPTAAKPIASRKPAWAQGL